TNQRPPLSSTLFPYTTLFRSIGHLSLLQKGLGKILMGRAIFGAKIHGGLQQRDGFVQVTFLQKDDAEVVLGNIVVRSDCKRMRKQRFAIAPVRRLNRGAPTQETNHNCSAGS